jgi:cytochrome bd-type quinol oxidase subunit 2
VAFGAVTALLLVAQAWLLATSISGAFLRHHGLGELRTPLVLLLAVIVGRAGLGWLSERTAARASAAAKSDLRTELVERLALLGPPGLDREEPGKLAVLATSGVDAIAAAWLAVIEEEGWAFTTACLTIASAVGSIFFELYPHVMVSTTSAAYSLTVANTASPSYTLKVMTVVAVVFFPVVLAYQAWNFWVFRSRIRLPRVGTTTSSTDTSQVVTASPARADR